MDNYKKKKKMERSLKFTDELNENVNGHLKARESKKRSVAEDLEISESIVRQRGTVQASLDRFKTTFSVRKRNGWWITAKM
jgi:predicted XRE-type DNA-binding protein